MSRIMDPWIKQMGYPLVNITRSNSSTTWKITQQKFQSDPSQSEPWNDSGYGLIKFSDELTYFDIQLMEYLFIFIMINEFFNIILQLSPTSDVCQIFEYLSPIYSTFCNQILKFLKILSNFPFFHSHSHSSVTPP